MPKSRSIRVLDPGAGSGMLSAALIDRLRSECPDAEVHVVAVENDPHLHSALSETLTELEGIGRYRWSYDGARRCGLPIMGSLYRSAI